eukprot:gene25728-34305_t
MVPIIALTYIPSSFRSGRPTRHPSMKTSAKPTTLKHTLTLKPSTFNPSYIPIPSGSPSYLSSTVIPSLSPSDAPTTAPSYSPTSTVPTLLPSYSPTTSIAPSFRPSDGPSSGSPSSSLNPSLGSPSALPSTAPSSSPSAPSVTPTSLPTGPSFNPTRAPTAAPSMKPSLFPTSSIKVNVTFSSQQVISGLSSATYYSDQSRYSLTLRATIASCMTGLTASNVAIVNVTDALAPSSRRGLKIVASSPLAASLGTSIAPAAAGPASEGIATTYIVSVASQYSVDDLQSQLSTSTTNGLFNKQLTSFAQKYDAAAFVNATSKALIIFTTAPTRAPSAAPVASTLSSPSSSDHGLGAGPIAGLVIMSVVVAALLCAGGYFYFSKYLTTEVIIHMASLSPSRAAMESPRSEGEDYAGSVIDSDDIMYQQDIVTVEGNAN